MNDYESYAVSDEGEVMNRKTGLILKPSGNPYPVVKIHSKVVRLHRLIAKMFCPKIDAPGLEVDHMNRDKTDNRACNLRWVDKSTNLRNRNSTNILKDKRCNSYTVRFRAEGKVIYCKSFKTMEEAVAARDAFRLSQAL